MTSAKPPQRGSIRPLARLYDVQTAYYDVTRRRKEASPEALLLVLQAMGAPLETFADVPAALRQRRQALWERGLEPVVVAWEGSPAAVKLSLPATRASGSLACELRLEDGELQRWELDLSGLPAERADEVEGVRYVVKRVALPSLPWGYHHLTLQLQRSLFRTMIISAPMRAYPPPGEVPTRIWGAFLPLYALHSRRSWGAGDLSDLEALMDWVAELGGRVVATLPLLASLLDEPFNPSPYTPVSRLFWNEFYVDVTRVPELERCEAARSLLASGKLRTQVEALVSSDLVDYRRQMALKRKLLEELARCLPADGSERGAALREFVEAHPAVEDYARFRAACERRRSPWPTWPERLRDGALKPGDYDEEAERYHLYVQSVAHEQVRRASEKADRNGQLMYLDLPLGVHPHGYDVWRHRDLFAADVSAGAPPDAVFVSGQDWGFPPLNPGKLREQHYQYVIAYLRHHLQHARILRIDHVMGLHRLFWIPKGLGAGEGVYVRYPAEEFYAILSLESRRHNAWIVGENLGTVPSYVDPAMSRHNIQSMYVAYYEQVSDARGALRAVPANSVASINTHDMPPFAASWRASDIEERLELGLLDKTGARTERRARQEQRKSLIHFLERKGLLAGGSADPRRVLRAILAFLSSSPARAVLVNLEDLWLETRHQNIPGTHDEHPNWQRKARYSLEAFREMPEVLDALREVDHVRKGGRG